MPDESDYRIPITADVSVLLSAFDEAGSAAESAGERIHAGFDEAAEGMEHGKEAAEEAGEGMEGLKEKMDEHLESLGKMTEGWTGLLSVIGAGAVSELMEKIAETTMELGDSIRQTSAALNVSNSDARGFNEAMSGLGVSSQAAGMAVRRLEVDAANGGKRLGELGISAKDASGHFKDGITIFQEVIDKLNGVADPGERSALAFQMLGRSGIQLMGVLDQINPAIEESIAAQEKNGAANQAAADQSLALHKALTELKSAWEDAIINMAPAVVAALNAITAAAQAATAAMGALAAADTAFWNQQAQHDEADFNKKWKAMHDPMATGEGLTSDYSESVMTMGTEQAYSLTAALQRGLTIQERLKMEGQAYADQVDRAANTLKDTVVTLPSHGGKGGKKGRGGGGADDFSGLEQAADTADKKMEQLNREFKQLGSEATMAAKEGGRSFDELRQAATNDFLDMQAKHREFISQVETGSKQGAQEAEKAWKDATAQFQKDWNEAAKRAQQDMQQMKSTADQISSEISGVLNSAISGKLNWQQELSKILSKMLDETIKYVFEMVAYMRAGDTMQEASQAASKNNMIGQLANYFAQSLGLSASTKATQVSSDAGQAAAGAYSSAAQIPYIGWLIAPAAAAAAEAGTLAYAAGGFDVPPGVSPLTQLHPREMVLPASLAQNVRNMTGGGGGGRGDNLSVTQNIHAIDSRSFLDIADSNGRGIASVVAKARRNGMQFGT